MVGWLSSVEGAALCARGASASGGEMQNNIMHHIYVLYSQKLKKKYIGVTSKNPRKRLQEHLSGQTPFTSRAKDWKLIYKKRFESKIEAYKEERFLKSGKGRESLKFILNDVNLQNVEEYRSGHNGAVSKTAVLERDT